VLYVLRGKSFVTYSVISKGGKSLQNHKGNCNEDIVIMTVKS